MHAIKTIAIKDIALDTEKNPRHDTFHSIEEAITHLCEDEQVEELARDIIKIGIMPTQLLAVTKINDSNKDGHYVALDGNRRLCAIKLLDNPKLAPDRLRSKFEKMHKDDAHKIKEINTVVYKDRKSFGPHLKRIHDGVQGGKGHKPWDPSRKAKAGYGTQKLGQVILDYAEKRGFISEKDKRQKTSLTQRYFGKVALQNIIGVNKEFLLNLDSNKSSKKIDSFLEKFCRDLVKKNLSAHATVNEIKKYAQRTINPTKGGDSPPPINPPDLPPIKPPTGGSSGGSSGRINRMGNILQAIDKIDIPKLCSIFLSMQVLIAEEKKPSSKKKSKTTHSHAILSYVGLSMLLEVLLKNCGMEKNKDKNIAESSHRYNFLKSIAKKSTVDTGIKDILWRIHKAGNINKHEKINAELSIEQLENDTKALEELIVELCEHIKENDSANKSR